MEKNRPRFGSDWDLDLGWILLWLVIISALVVIVYFIADACVKSNYDTVSRDKYYADHCKVVFEVPNNGGKAYQCQNK